MQLPRPRGPLSSAVIDRLAGRTAALATPANTAPDDTLGEDHQLALWVLYELHYRGFDDSDPQLEWAPDLLAFRAALEGPFEQALRDLAEAPTFAGGAFADRLLEVIDAADGPSLATHVQRDATAEQVCELMVQRSIYHLKESDPSSWQVPRLPDPVKAALVELLYDEYGGGRPARVHATLFAEALGALDLDPSYGAHIDRVPAYTLAENNAMSLFGLHRRLRGAAMGHLAAFETTSSLPCRRFARGIRRLGLPEPVAHYFDEHVEADAVHEQVAVRHICQRLVDLEPDTVGDVLLGAAVCLELGARTAAAMLRAWDSGDSTLLPEPIGAVA